MRKLLTGITVAALAALLAVPAMAAEWEDSATATITVEKMCSLWGLEDFSLTVEDVAGGGVGPNGKFHGQVIFLSNCNTDVYVKVDQIPNSTEFHIVVNPNPTNLDWRSVTTELSPHLTSWDAWLLWDRNHDGSYKTGGNRYEPNTFVPVYTSHAPFSPSTTIPVDYGIQLCSEGTVPAPGTYTTEITWQIVASP